MEFRYFKKYAIKSPLLPAAARHSIERHVGRRDWIKLKFHIDEPYTGKVDGSVFRIRPTSKVSSDLVPLISGKIHPFEQGSIVAVKVGLSFGGYFLMLWLALSSFSCFCILLHPFNPEALLALGPLLIIWVMYDSSISFQMKNAKRDLLTYLEGEEVLVRNKYDKKERKKRGSLGGSTYRK